ncbi:glycosyltransferase family 4 protein, partial [bacterium]|nr:glycosyltransferase family 4 protein [bacterium]
VDNNLIRWSKEWSDKKPRHKVITRGIDIDLWMRGPLGVDWSKVDDLILINDWMEGAIRNYLPNTELPPITVIPCGVDPSRWEYKERINPGFHLAYVGNMWEIKNPARAIEILYLLVKRHPELPYKLTLVGSHDSLKNHAPYYLNHLKWLITRYKLEERVVFHEERIEDLSAFYGTVDYLLVTSYKEGFSYVTGEAMLCGVKPVIYNFWNAEKVWPSELIYVTHDEAVDIINGEYHSRQYRDYVLENYHIDKQLAAYDKIIN